MKPIICFRSIRNLLAVFLLLEKECRKHLKYPRYLLHLILMLCIGYVMQTRTVGRIVFALCAPQESFDKLKFYNKNNTMNINYKLHAQRAMCNVYNEYNKYQTYFVCIKILLIYQYIVLIIYNVI